LEYFGVHYRITIFAEDAKCEGVIQDLGMIQELMLCPFDRTALCRPGSTVLLPKTQLFFTIQDVTPSPFNLINNQG